MGSGKYGIEESEKRRVKMELHFKKIWCLISLMDLSKYIINSLFEIFSHIDPVASIFKTGLTLKYRIATP